MLVRKIYVFSVLLLLSVAGISQEALAKTITLTSQRQLTIEMVNEVANGQAQVALSGDAKKNVQAGYDAVMQAALNNKAVYGLTVGVGWNKDKPVFHEANGQKILSPELLQLSRAFNASSLRAHASGLGQPLSEHIVRASMVIRLNTFLNGEAGVSPAVAQQYVDFLNKKITPVVPEKGSVGEADITLASHIGLAMVGEWDVFYGGKRIPAQQAMRRAGVKPLVPVGKDFLSILSTNSLMAAQAVDVLNQSQRFYDKQVKLFALMLEGFDGNVAPFSHSAVDARPYPAMQKAAADIRAALAGSDLWRPDGKRALQDPLSYRSMAYSLGELGEANQQLRANLLIQINHTDDNPLVLIHGLAAGDNSPQMQQYEVNGSGSAAIVPTSNFNFLPVARSASQLNEAMAKLAEVMTQQLIRMENPDMTKLPRFLAAAQNEGHAFGAIQKPFVAVNQEIKTLAQPLWFSGATVAGNIEDTVSMSNQILMNSHAIVDGLYDISAFQLLHATQALNLCKGFQAGGSSRELKRRYRQQVPFISEDTATTKIIETSKYFWMQY